MRGVDRTSNCFLYRASVYIDSKICFPPPRGGFLLGGFLIKGGINVYGNAPPPIWLQRGHASMHGLDPPFLTLTQEASPGTVGPQAPLVIKDSRSISRRVFKSQNPCFINGRKAQGSGSVTSLLRPVTSRFIWMDSSYGESIGAGPVKLQIPGVIYVYGRAGARTTTYITRCAARETFGNRILALQGVRKLQISKHVLRPVRLLTLRPNHTARVQLLSTFLLPPAPVVIATWSQTPGEHNVIILL